MLFTNGKEEGSVFPSGLSSSDQVVSSNITPDEISGHNMGCCPVEFYKENGMLMKLAKEMCGQEPAERQPGDFTCKGGSVAS